jgi:3-isopropylmalate/(R)-2-methylmalate dehydratase small subunit
MPHVVEGRVWKFGDNINTDLIFPNTAFRLPESEQYKLTFSSNRPGWVDQVRPGDLLVGGENFGMGSGRPSGRMLQLCGIAGVVAETLNGLCLRNCVTAGLAATQCKGVTNLFEEGDIGRFDFSTGLITNVTRGVSLQGQALDQLLLDIIDGGGVLPMLVREGYIEPRPYVAPSR